MLLEKKPEVERERRSDERGRRSAAVREELSEAQSKPTQDERWGKEKGVQERVEIEDNKKTRQS